MANRQYGAVNADAEADACACHCDRTCREQLLQLRYCRSCERRKMLRNMSVCVVPLTGGASTERSTTSCCRRNAFCSLMMVKQCTPALLACSCSMPG